MPLLRQRVERLGEHGVLVHLDGDLARAGAEHCPPHPNEVTSVEHLLKPAVGVHADMVAAEGELEATGNVLNCGEGQLAMRPQAHEAPGDGGFDA